MRTTRSDNNPSGGKPSPACRHIQRQLPLYLDGELSTRQGREVERHLAVCSFCQSEREQWRQSEQALAAARRHIPAPGDLRTGFYARLAAPPASHRLFPRIDWRVAVPALAACGLVFGWLTAKNSVMPSSTGSRTAASSPVSHPKIAQANNPVQNGVTANKPAGSAVQRSGFGGDNPVRLPAFDASDAVAFNKNKKSDNGLKKRVKRQRVALLNPRHKQPESGNAAKTRRPAAGSSSNLYYEVTQPADVAAERSGEAKPARPRSRQQNSYSFGESHPEFNWQLALQRSKSSTQGDTNTLSNILNSDTVGKMSGNVFSYMAAAAKSKQKEELKEQSLLPSPAQDTFAVADGVHEFALGLNDSTRRSFQGDNRGLALSASVGEDKGMYLEVEDTKRGFTSRTRFASRVQEQNGQRVLIIEAEDAAPRAAGETQSTPVSEQK